MKDLQQIKDEVARELGYKTNSVFNAYEQLLINPHGSTYRVLNDSVDKIAIRYAKEQKRELVAMLERCLSFIDELKNHGITNWSEERELRDLITKHKQS